MIHKIQKCLFSLFFHSMIIAFIFSAFNFRASAQIVNLKNDLLHIKALSDSLNQKLPPEKLYLQFDKPWYAVNDTIWFKAYLFNAAFLTPTDKSGIMYLDIANDSSKIIKQYRFPVQSGISWGNIALDEKEFKAGTYTIRAYTNWMRNFGDDYFFYKSFYVAGFGENNWLVYKREKDSIANNVKVAEVKLLFSNMDKNPLMVEPLQLAVMNGSKNLYKQNIRTDLGGAIDVNFALPQKASGLAIVAQNTQKDKKAVIPIVLNRPENIDVQFLPEGGNLVTGFPAHIGFKAIGEDGKGINVSGIVTGKDQKQVAEFQSLHNGMGSFDLAVTDGESYTAKVTLPDGATKQFPLPAVKSSGTVLQVKNAMKLDSITVTILATNDIVQSGESYFLFGKARGVICYAAIVNFHEVNFLKRKIAKSLFPAGIVHFTLMTTKYQPVNERLAFIDHLDNLHIQFVANKPNYRSRDSVALKIKVTDNTGKPVKGNFLLAVTDDAQVKKDTLSDENIITRLLLTSELKGYIEQPGDYLFSKKEDAWPALDNLLLTQGWVGYDWKNVFIPPAIAYQPEHELTVKGSVLNVFGGHVKGTDVLLFSKSPAMLFDTTTDKDGRFAFNRFPRVDTPLFVLKTINKHGNNFNVRIQVDEPAPLVFTKPFTPVITPWYVNSDTTLLNYAKTDALAAQERNFPKGLVLKEVKITAKKIVKGSLNLNGPGEADIVLDEKDMEKAGKKNWLQLLQENISGFRIGSYFGTTHTSVNVGNTKGQLAADFITNTPIDWYFIKYKWVVIIVDGVQLDSVITMSSGISLFDERAFLTSHDAEDIKGIEVNFSDKYSVAYLKRFHLTDTWRREFAFVEITTRSGNGPWLGNTPGLYLYKPLPLSWPQQFYKPKYAVNNAVEPVADLRSTIDWEPNINTNSNGEARLWFYTAVKPSTYTLIVEGSDRSGSLGFKCAQIKVDAINKQLAK